MRVLPLLALLAACAAAPQDEVDDTDLALDRTLADVLLPGPHGVGVATRRLVDTSRMRQPNGDDPGARTRDLPTEIWYPATAGSHEAPARDAAPLPGPFPVVVFSHGFMSLRTDHAGLAAFLASHGYAFAAMDFPLSNRGAPGGPTVMDVDEQARDVGFVLTEVLGDATLGPVLDADHVVFAGMSLGGFTTLLAGLHPDLRDERVDLLVPIAPSSCYVPARAFDAPSPPTLVVHGTSDQLVPFDANARTLYDALDGEKLLVALEEGSHTGFPDVTAALFDGADHPDTIGCSSIGGTLPDDEEGSLDEVFGEGESYLVEDCPLPCADGAPTTRAMRPTRQVELLKAAMRTFLDAWVHGDAGARAWVTAGLDAEPDVTVTASILPWEG